MLLKSLFGIVGHRTNADNEWSYIEEGHADVFILDFDDNENRIRAKHTAGMVVGFSRDTNLLNGHDFTLHKPLRSRDLLHLLDELDLHLAKQNGSGNSALRPLNGQLHRSTETDCLDEFFALLRKYPEHQFSFRFDNERIFVDTRKKRVYFDTDFSYQTAVSGQRADFKLLAALPETPLTGVSLADFFYEFTVQEREAHLLAELSQAEKFQIKQWPQFVNAANTKAMIRVSAYFSKHKASLHTAARELDVDNQQLIGFINAVHAQNLLVYDMAAANALVNGSAVNTMAHSVAPVASAPMPPPEKNNNKVAGLFGRIRARLGI